MLRPRGRDKLMPADRTLPLRHSMNLDKVQSLKNQEGLPFSSHYHSLLIHDTRSTYADPAHIVSSTWGSLGPLNPRPASAELP